MQQQEAVVEELRRGLGEKGVAVTQLNAQNQKLLESSVELQTRIKEYEETFSEEYCVLNDKLHAEVRRDIFRFQLTFRPWFCRMNP